MARRNAQRDTGLRHGILRQPSWGRPDLYEPDPEPAEDEEIVPLDDWDEDLL
jgi:hypothetical protein